MPLLHATRIDPDFCFDVQDQSGHTLRLDIPVEQGGAGSGFRPMQLLLAALCGCSGVDVVLILRKQRQQLQGLEILADGEREKDAEPALWKSLRVEFRLTGEVEPSKALRAVDLSMEKYCSVAETLRRAGATLEWAVTVNGEACTR